MSNTTRAIEVIRFPAAYSWDVVAGCWVGYIRALDVYSAGATREDAIMATTLAGDMFVRICLRRNINPLRQVYR